MQILTGVASRVALVSFLLFPSSMNGQNVLSEKSLYCSLRTGVATDFTKDEPAISLREYGKRGDFVFDSINLAARSARMVLDNTATEVIILPTSVGITFLDVALAGLFVTTVYNATDGKGQYKVVDSRHSMMPLFDHQPIPQQYYGSCSGSASRRAPAGPP